jgi:hypothetical protein
MIPRHICIATAAAARSQRFGTECMRDLFYVQEPPKQNQTAMCRQRKQG